MSRQFSKFTYWSNWIRVCLFPFFIILKQSCQMRKDVSTKIRLILSKNFIFKLIRFKDVLNIPQTSTVPLRLLLIIRSQPVIKVILLHPQQIFNPFHTTVLFLYPLKTSENKRFAYVFNGYGKRPVAVNALTILRFKYQSSLHNFWMKWKTQVLIKKNCEWVMKKDDKTFRLVEAVTWRCF